MLSDEEFLELLQRTRLGDQEAAKRLVQEYEPEIRRAARLRLTDPKLRRLVDSIDICQSVFGRFFQGALEGAFNLENPQQLLVLLTTMTRNRVIDEHRKQSAAKRSRDNSVGDLDADQLCSDEPGPKTALIRRELVELVRTRLNEDELKLAELRAEGCSWDEIGRQLNQSPEGLRKRLERALSRVRVQLQEEAQE